MDPAGIRYSPKTPESPRESPRIEPRSPRHSAIRRALFPPPQLQNVKAAPVEAVWTEKLLQTVGEFVSTLPEARDVMATARSLIKKTIGLDLTDTVVGKVKALPDHMRARIFHRICDLLARNESEGKVRSLLEAIKAAAAEIHPNFDTIGQEAMQKLVASLGSGNLEAIEHCARDLQAIVEQRSGRYGRSDPELDQETGRLGYLGRWARSALAGCSTDDCAAIFDSLVSNIRTAREPINSRIGTALLDEICPQIAGSLTTALINEETRTGAVDRFYWFLYLCLSRGSLSEQSISARVDDALQCSGCSRRELQQLAAALSMLNETVGNYIGERVRAKLSGK
jgi:hypothetical protein